MHATTNEAGATRHSKGGAPDAGVPCQLEAFPTRIASGPPSREEPWSWYLKRRLQGWLMRARHELDGLGARLRGSRPLAPPPAPDPGPAPELEVGDRVRVRSAEEIRATLDANGFLKGCGFGLGQYQYCGREFRVIRRVDRFFDEGRARMLKGRNLVLLDGVHCDGASSRWTHGCDRMCFYFWRTEWLEKLGEQD